MSALRTNDIPLEILETLDQVEAFAQGAGLDFYDVLWANATMADVYRLAHRSGITAAELMVRMLAARGLDPAQDGAA